MRRLLRPTALAALALLALPAPGRAQGAPNLVRNPGFEDRPFHPILVPDGYTVTGGQYTYANPDTFLDHTGGTAFMFADPAPERPTLTQTLATTPGTRYRIGFFAAHYQYPLPDLGNRLTVTFGGVTVFDAMLTNEFYDSDGHYGGDPYLEFAVTGIAAGASTDLTFSGYNERGAILIDDLSVTALPTSTVPEPATWATMAAGLGGVGLVARRRRTQPAA